jgi:hypothetical protein
LLERIKAFVKRRQFGIVSKCDNHVAVGAIQHPQTGASKLVGVHYSAEFEDQHQSGVHPEWFGAGKMAQADVSRPLLKSISMS